MSLKTRINNRTAARFLDLPYAILDDVIWSNETIDHQSNLKEDISNLIVSIVPADGLAPLGARTSAGAVVPKPRMCTWPARDGISIEMTLILNNAVCVTERYL